MAAFIGSRYGRYRKILIAVLLLLVALSVAVILPGCGGNDAVVETEDGEETEEETAPEDEVEEENEETSDSWEEEEEGDDGESVELGQEYTNDMYGFSVAYPDGWECVETENGNGCSISDPGNELFIALAWALPDEGKTAMDWLDHLYTTVESTHGASGTGNWLIERDPDNIVNETLNGADYIYQYWTYEAAGADYYYDVMVMVEGGEAFFLTAQYPADDVDEIDPIVGAMIDSFTLP